MSTDPYREWDAAYVLGALPPGERREFEEHLATCDACRAAVGEIAGLPGLLGQVPVEDAVAADVTAEAAGATGPGPGVDGRRVPDDPPAGPSDGLAAAPPADAVAVRRKSRRECEALDSDISSSLIWATCR